MDPAGSSAGMEPGVRLAAGLSTRVMFVRRTLPRLQTVALTGTCTTQPEPEQESPGPGATQCFTTPTEPLMGAGQESEAAGASISEAPKRPFAEAVCSSVTEPTVA